MNRRRPILAFGHGFAGTRLLSRMFSACSEVDARHETSGLQTIFRDVYEGRSDARDVLRDWAPRVTHDVEVNG